MAKTVDERIVAAKFDASDFEKGVDKTLKKLDELKKSLDFKEATKGVKELAEKTEVSTNSLSSSLEKLTDRFTTFTGMIKQKILGGLVDEVANVFFKMEQGVKSFIKSVSTDQISAGMSKYEQMLTSVRIMMSAGETEGAAYEAIGKLRDYSDQTSYSLSQMTDALSKLRAAGVDLDKATRSVEGIANACANAGINASDAQRAFFNLSQAYSSGVLKYTDYRSLELLNMTTDDFKEKILEAAVEAKTLKKVSEGVYQTISTGNKKVTAGKKVTKQNLQDMLRYNFVTSDVMNELFGGKFFFDEQKFKEYKSKYKTLDEAIAAAKKDFGETAVNAYLAAREARSFTDVMNTLKDVVSTGWSTTFEHLFGKLEQAKHFFTELAEGGIADAIYKIGEYRNSILEFWDDTIAGVDSGGGEVLRQAILKISDAIGTLLKTVLDILPGFHELDEESDDAENNFRILGDRLFMLTMSFRDTATRIKNAAEQFRIFMNSSTVEGGPTRIEKIRSVIINLGSAFGVIGRVISLAITAFNRMYNALYPVFDGILIFIEKITSPLRALKDSQMFDDIEHSVNNIATILGPIAIVVEKIVSFLGDVGKFFVQMAIDTAASNISFFTDVLGLFMELLTGKSSQMKDGEGILARIAEDFNGIKDACKAGLDALNKFFGALIGDLKKVFGLSDDKDQNGGVFSGVIDFFKTNEFVADAKKWVNNAIVDVGNFIKSIPSRVKMLGANIYDIIKKLLFTKQTDKKTNEEKEILTPLGEWLTNVIAKVKAFILDIPNKIVKGVGKVFNWIDMVFDAVFGTGNKKPKEQKSDVAKDALITQFDEFIASVKKSISDWFRDLPNKINSAFKTVGGFFTNLIKVLDEFFFGKKEKKKIMGFVAVDEKTQLKSVTRRIKTGFSKWLDGFVADMKKFLKNIPNYIKKGIKGAGDIISMIVEGVFGKKNATGGDLENKLKKPLVDINLNSIMATIKDIGWTLINQISRIFTGTEDIDKNKEWLANKIHEAIDWVVAAIPDFIKKAWELAKRLGINVWTGIKGIFNKDIIKDDSPAITKIISDVGSEIITWLTNKETGLPHYVDEAWEWLKKTGYSIWTGLKGAFIEGGIDASESELAQKIYDVGTNIKIWLTDSSTGLPHYIDEAWEWLKQTGHNIWVGFKSIFTTEGLPSDNDSEVAAFINSVGEKIKKWFTNDESGFPYYFRMAWNALKEFGTNVFVGFKSLFSEEGLPEDNQSVVANFIHDFGEKIKLWFTDDVNGFPAIFRNAWTAVSNFKSGVFEGIAAVFGGDIPESEVGITVMNLGNKIKDFLTTDVKDSLVEKIPTFLKSMWAIVSTLVKDVFNGLSAVFTGEIPENEISLAIFEIGNKIKTFILVDVKDWIVKNLPDLIHTAWDTLAAIGTDVFFGFASIFTGKTPANEVQQAIFDLGTMIKDFIITDLPAMIKSAFDTVAKMINGEEEDPIVSRLVGTSDVNKQAIEAIKKEQDQVNARVEGETKKNGFWTFITSIKDSLLAAFGDIGPTILNALADALDWIGHIATYIMDALTGKTDIGEDIEKAYGKEKPELVASLKRIGESLKNFFLTTLPKFIGSAIGALIVEAPNWFAELFGAIGDAEKAAADKEMKNQESDEDIESLASEVANAKGVLGIVSTIFDGLKNFIGDNAKQILAVTAVLIALSIVFRQLRDLFSIADEIEAFGYTLKWSAITIGMVAIVMIINSLTDLIKNGTPEQIDRLNGFMDDLKELLNGLTLILAIFTGKSIADAIEAIADTTKAAKSAGGSSGAGGAIGGMLLSFVEKLGGTILVGGGIEIIGAAIADTLEGLKQSIVNLGESLSSILNPILEFANKLSSSKDTFQSGIDAIDALKDLIVKFYTAFDGLMEEATSIQFEKDEMLPGQMMDSGYHYTNPNTNKKEWLGQNVSSADLTISSIRVFIEVFKERISLFLDTIEVLDRMLTTLNKVDDVESIKDKIKTIITVLNDEGENSFTALITRLFETISNAFIHTDIFSELDYRGYTNDSLRLLEAARVYTSIMSDIMSVFGGSLAKLDTSQIKAFNHFLNVFQRIGAVLNTEISGKLEQNNLHKILFGDTTLPTIGRVFKEFSAHIKEFYDNVALIKGFSESDIKETKAKTETFIDLFNVMLGAKPLVSNFETIAPFISNIPGFALAFGEFYTNLNKYITTFDDGKISNMVDTTKAMAELLSAIAKCGVPSESFKSFLLNFGDYGPAIGEFISSVWYGISDIEDIQLNNAIASVNAVSTIMSTLSSLDFKRLKDTFSNSDTFIQAAKIISEGIQSALDSDPNFQIKITPVLNMDTAKMQLQDFFGIGQLTDVDLGAMARSVYGANAQTDEDRVTYTLLSQEIDRVTVSIDNLKNSQVTAADVTNAFAGMRIVADTGALVGSITDDIDAAIGKKIWLIERGVAPVAMS